MYRSYYRPHATMASKQAREVKDERKFDAATVWAAAAYADRVNGGEYIKETIRNFDTGEITKVSNRDIVKAQLAAGSLDVTNEDRDVGLLARDFHKKTLLFRALKGQLNEFEQLVNRVIAVDEFGEKSNSYELAIVPSQIRTARQGMALAEATSDVERDPLAPVGAKVEATLIVVKCVYSVNYGVYFVTGKTDTKHMVFFSYRNKVSPSDVMHIKGTVKAHRDDATQLTRVKVV